RRTRLFLLTLGDSRKSGRRLTWQSSSRIWAELHERAFARLGGAPAVIVLDNLREGVLRPDVYEPTLNPLYRDVLAHYGVTALPCRVGDPDRKGKVESGIGHTPRTPLKGLRFERLADAQVYLDHWEARWGEKRIHGTTKRQVAAMFAVETRHPRTSRAAPRRAARTCDSAPPRPMRTMRSAPCAASRGCWPSPARTAPPPATPPAPSRSTSARPTSLSAATSSAIRRHCSRCA